MVFASLNTMQQLEVLLWCNAIFVVQHLQSSSHIQWSS
jgi:hypothetical protein